MNKKKKRQAALLKIIGEQGMVPVKIMASMLQVSQMTIHRDLVELKDKPAELEENKEHREDSDGGTSYNLFQAIQNANEQKEKIGKFAAGMLNEGDVVILDTGSTTNRMLPHIPTDKNISVVCFNANVLLELRHKPGIRIFFAGGIYHPNTEMCESPEGIGFLRRLRANKVFLSAAGVHETLGVTCANEYEIATKNTIIQSASEHILLVDSGKFGRVHSSHFCDMDVIHSVVTDQNISKEWRSILKAAGIAVYTV
ncbi:MAG: DeoR/GlpR family DNA-binding transcription regulator [Hungatella sp.]|nr:DeoR/GlpR family DNA-binding transcription regulator [Hungatella sp.]